MSEVKLIPGKDEGVVIFKPNNNAPDFVLGDFLIKPKLFQQWLRSIAKYATEHEGEAQLKLQILNGDYGPYLKLNTYDGSKSSEAKQAKPKTVKKSTPIDDDVFDLF